MTTAPFRIPDLELFGHIGGDIGDLRPISGGRSAGKRRSPEAMAVRHPVWRLLPLFFDFTGRG
jgi:hypothetical protein